MMARLGFGPCWLSAVVSLLLLSIAAPVQGLYFYLDSTTAKCFYEELPRDTMVVGKYHAEEWNPSTNSYAEHADLKITITVDELFDNHHSLVKNKGSSNGRFTFSAAEAGEHRICFMPSRAAHGGILMGGVAIGTVRLTLDLVIGETNKIESTDKKQIEGIVQRVQDLKSRLEDVRKEQVFQREREAEFRDQSETTNARVVRWTIIQLIVLGVTCAWQLSHLRAFFIKQKLT